MEIIVPAFQFEIRFNHLLNFSTISRNVLAPFVKLTQSIKVENQNTLNERFILNFSEENSLMIVSWDRIIYKGQGDINSFVKPNSPIQMPFLLVLEKLKAYEEFESISNALFVISYIKKLNLSEEKLYDAFSDKFLSANTKDLMSDVNDLAVNLEYRTPNSETNITFGPYKGPFDLERRPLAPVNINSLDNIDFTGIMFEYKHGYTTKSVELIDFANLVSKSQDIFKKTWKVF